MSTRRLRARANDRLFSVQKGFVCELCRSTSVAYPFQIEITHRVGGDRRGALLAIFVLFAVRIVLQRFSPRLLAAARRRLPEMRATSAKSGSLAQLAAAAHRTGFATSRQRGCWCASASLRIKFYAHIISAPLATTLAVSRRNDAMFVGGRRALAIARANETRARSRERRQQLKFARARYATRRRSMS